MNMAQAAASTESPASFAAAVVGADEFAANQAGQPAHLLVN